MTEAEGPLEVLIGQSVIKMEKLQKHGEHAAMAETFDVNIGNFKVADAFFKLRFETI